MYLLTARSWPTPQPSISTTAGVESGATGQPLLVAPVPGGQAPLPGQDALPQALRLGVLVVMSTCLVVM